MDTKQQTLQGVAFPLHGDAMEALQKFRDQKFNYVQLVKQICTFHPFTSEFE